MNNYERIKAMTEDELADFLEWVSVCSKFCPNRDICAAIHDECDGSVWYEWLGEEADE